MSVNTVDKASGSLVRIAGNTTDKVGNLSQLHTTNKSSVVAAINEVADGGGGEGSSVFIGTHAEWEALPAADRKAYDMANFTDDYDPAVIGDLSSLDTTDKSSIVAAINEINANKQQATFTGTLTEWSSLTVEERKLYDIANFTDDYDSTSIGDMSTLTTTDKSSIVGAINEVNNKVSPFSIVNGTLMVTYTKTTTT